MAPSLPGSQSIQNLSIIAASAVYAARCTLEKSPIWTDTLKHHTGYSKDQLRDCAKLWVKYHFAAAEAVYRKFSSPDCSGVALLTPDRRKFWRLSYQ